MCCVPRRCHNKRVILQLELSLPQLDPGVLNLTYQFGRRRSADRCDEHVCVSVRVSVREHVSRITRERYFAAPSSSGGVAIRYVLPVLRTTLQYRLISAITLLFACR